MSGYKNTGQSSIEYGSYDPLDAKINFAVPNNINVNDTSIAPHIPDIRGPGKFPKMIDMIASSNSQNSFVLTFDGKKTSSWFNCR